MVVVNLKALFTFFPQINPEYYNSAGNKDEQMDCCYVVYSFVCSDINLSYFVKKVTIQVQILKVLMDRK